MFIDNLPIFTYCYNKCLFLFLNLSVNMMFFCRTADCEKMPIPLIGIYSLMLTIEFFVFGFQCFAIDVVLCDETPLLV